MTNDEQQVKPGVSVFVEGDVQGSGVVLEVGGRLLKSGSIESGWARVRIDGTGEEITVDQRISGRSFDSVAQGSTAVTASTPSAIAFAPNMRADRVIALATDHSRAIAGAHDRFATL